MLTNRPAPTGDTRHQSGLLFLLRWGKKQPVSLCCHLVEVFNFWNCQSSVAYVTALLLHQPPHVCVHIFFLEVDLLSRLSVTPSGPNSNMHVSNILHLPIRLFKSEGDFCLFPVVLSLSAHTCFHCVLVVRWLGRRRTVLSRYGSKKMRKLVRLTC